MTKKLLLSIAVTLAGSVAIAALHPVQFMNKEFIKQNFTPTVEQTDKAHTQSVVRAKATDTQVFFEDFETFNTTTMLPEGWVVFDNLDNAITTANIIESTSGYYTAFSGNNGLSSMYNDDASRDGWAIAPGITLEGGHTYHFGIYAFCMGYNKVVDEWTMTIGTAQTIEAQNTIIIDHSGSNATQDEDWILCSGTFTPATTGTYYLAIHHCTETPGGNIAMWDYIQVDSDHIRILPEGSLFSKGGLWSMDGHFADENGNIESYRAYIQDGETFQYGCAGTNIESLIWDFGPYATTPDYEVAQPIVTHNFPNNTDEVYNDVILTMINADGESFAMREFFLNRIGNNETYSDFVGNIRPEDGFYLYGAGSSGYDALSGLNSYYTRLAERFVVPSDVNVTISGAYMIPLYYNMSVINRKKDVTIKVLLADANNNPGEVVYMESLKLENVFGSQAFQGSTLAAIPFTEEVKVKGTFFIEIEFPEGISIGSNNHLFLATTSARSFEGDNSSFFYNATATSEAEEGWYSATDYYGAGFSTAIFPLVTFHDISAVSAPQVSDCTVFVNGNELNVVNAPNGSDIVVTDLTGRVVLVAQANTVKTTINTGLNAGIYIVTVNGNSTKVAIR